MCMVCVCVWCFVCDVFFVWCVLHGVCFVCLRNGSGDDFTGSFMDNFSLGIGVAPGLIMFLNNYSAIEVNVGVLGFNYNSSKQKNDQIYLSKTHSSTTPPPPSTN